MKRIAVLFTVFIIVIIVLADTGTMPHFISVIYDFPGGDKIGHVVLFGLLNFLITRATLSALDARRPVWVALTVGFILALFVATEEYSQRYFPNRTADWFDLAANFLGMLVGGLIAFDRRVRG